jgi:hypothetical protein
MKNILEPFFGELPAEKKGKYLFSRPMHQHKPEKIKCHLNRPSLMK